MSFTVKQIIGNNRKPVTVYNTDLVTKAQELMVKRKFSQLPVIDKLRASRIAIYHVGTITDSAKELARLREWAVGAMVRFQKVIEQQVGEIG